jgi:hypothetical protein
MKNKFLKISIAIVMLATGIWACKKSFLETSPYGQYGDEQLLSAKGIDAVLIGAYGMLDGESQFKYGENWFTPVTNWVYGDIASDDAYKGTDANDQPPMTTVETYNTIPSTQGLYARWISIYDGIARANDVIKIIGKTKTKAPKELSAADETRLLGEARFIRGFQHFEAIKMWNNIPVITDTTTVNPGNPGGAAAAWKFIEADFSYAYANLPATQSQLGRINKWAAGAYLAKAYLYQKKFAEALTLFNTIIASGVNVGGTKFALQDAYWKNFDARFENTSESVFSVQMAAQGSQEGDANRGYGLAFPYGGDFGCCGFLQPSQNLVNAYKTSATGLPLFGTYNDVDVKNDAAQASSDPFTLGTENVDPRLDWSVGRRSVPFWDWGGHPGRNWIRDVGYAGPYSPKKHVYSAADINSFTANGWRNMTAKNYNAMRFADLLLMTAECEVEVGSLERARTLVNQVRDRAKNPASAVAGSPAKYVINSYTAAWTDKAVAREAVRWERRLELAMEGHRFFDLARYGNGYAAATLNAYLNVEKNKRLYLKSSPGFQAKNEFYPIPERAIVLSKGALKQNPGY